MDIFSTAQSFTWLRCVSIVVCYDAGSILREIPPRHAGGARSGLLVVENWPRMGASSVQERRRIKKKKNKRRLVPLVRTSFEKGAEITKQIMTLAGNTQQGTRSHTGTDGSV